MFYLFYKSLGSIFFIVSYLVKKRNSAEKFRFYTRKCFNRWNQSSRQNSPADEKLWVCITFMVNVIYNYNNFTLEIHYN